MTPRRRDDDEDFLAMAFGAAPYANELRYERDPDDDPEDDWDEDEDEEDRDEDDEDDGDDDYDELEF